MFWNYISVYISVFLANVQIYKMDVQAQECMHMDMSPSQFYPGHILMSSIVEVSG